MVNGREIAKSKAEERLHKITTIRRRRRTQTLIMASGILFILIAGVQIYRSGVFNVKRIDVSGNKAVSAVKIVESCNVGENANIFSVSTDEIKQRILKDPQIKDVAVKRVFPQSLKVEVVERAPMASISHGGKFYFIDDDHFVISECQYADGAGVPTITDLPLDKIKVGERIMNDSLENALKCLDLMDPEFKKSVGLVSASSVDKLTLYITKNKDNIEILYGEAKPARDKNKILETILQEQGKQVIFIDVRSYPHSDPVLRRIDSVP